MSARTLTAAALLMGLTGCIIHVDTNGKDWSTSYTHSGHRVRGNGVRATEERQVEAFDEVLVAGQMDVRVRVGYPQRVTVRGEENVMSYLRTSAENGRLELKTDPAHLDVDHDFVVEVDVPDLIGLTLNGTGDGWVEGVDRQEFFLRLRGSGDLEAIGNADVLDVSVHGSGDIDLDRLQARKATVEISGSGDVRLSVSEDLQADISGSGDVSYYGDPATEMMVSGSGNLRRMRE